MNSWKKYRRRASDTLGIKMAFFSTSTHNPRINVSCQHKIKSKTLVSIITIIRREFYIYISPFRRWLEFVIQLTRNQNSKRCFRIEISMQCHWNARRGIVVLTLKRWTIAMKNAEQRNCWMGQYLTTRKRIGPLRFFLIPQGRNICVIFMRANVRAKKKLKLNNIELEQN